MKVEVICKRGLTIKIKKISIDFTNMTVLLKGKFEDKFKNCPLEYCPFENECDSLTKQGIINFRLKIIKND